MGRHPVKKFNQELILKMNKSGMCPVCRSANVSSFLEILDVPVHIGALWSTQKSAKQCSRGNIILGFCSFCEFITNLSFDPSLLDYSQAYDNSLDFSARFQKFARLLALRLIERYDLFEKDLIEIGCGKGQFLGLLCELGGNRGVGFDPGIKREKTDRKLLKYITFIDDYYSERYDDLKADFICCRHVLEHIHNPTNFLTRLRFTLGDRLNTAVYFEVPNVRHTLNGLSIWDIIYEHCSYFSQESLATAFTLCGFQVRELSEAYEGQFLAIEAFPDKRRNVTQSNDGWVSKGIAHEIVSFADKFQKKLEFWQENLERLGNSRKRVVLWGAGAKGVTFLNLLKNQNYIPYVVDVNPRKQGFYIGGTAQKIVSPKFLQTYKPDTVIVMNKIYRKEISEMVNGLGLQPIFLYA